MPAKQKKQARRGKSSTCDSVQTTRNESVDIGVKKKPFNPNDPKYMCCCCFQIRKATIWFVSIFLVMDAINFILAMTLTDWTGFTIILYMIRILLFPNLIFGALLKDENYSAAPIVYGCLMCIGYAIAAIIVGVENLKISKERSIPTEEIIKFLGYCFESVFVGIFAWMAFKCFRYLYDLKAANSQTLDTRDETEV